MNSHPVAPAYAFKRRSRRKPRARHAPREHGFWVMLAVTVLAALMLEGSEFSLGLTMAVISLAIAGATLVGRRIRKNVALQLASAPLIAALVVPLGWGAVAIDVLLFTAAGLGLVFLATTMSVQAILLRARKKFRQARLLESAAFVAAAAGAMSAYSMEGGQRAAALLVCASFVAGLVWFRPSARHLRRVGMSVALVQLIAATLLVL